MVGGLRIGGWLALLLGTAAAVCLLLPAEHVPGRRPGRLVLSAAHMRPDTGLAHRVRIDPELERLAAQLTEPVLLEDDRPLRPSADPEEVRRSPGCWNVDIQRLLLSASDGSDPRFNGRRYAILDTRPAVGLAPTTRRAATTLAACALAAVLAALWPARAGARRSLLPLRSAALLLAGAAAWLVPPLFPWWRWEQELAAGAALQPLAARAVERGAVQALPAPVATAPRTRRLITATDAPDFEPTGAAPVPRRPVEVALGPGADGPVSAGPLRVDRRQRLTSPAGLDLTVDQLAHMLLRTRVEAGSELKLSFHTTREDDEPLWVPVPVAPDGAWHTLAIERPLERGALLGAGLLTGQVRIDRIELEPGPGSAPLTLELEPLRFSDAMAVYSLATHGHELREIGPSSRPALWQSVPGRFALPWRAADGDLLKGSLAVLGPEGARASFQVSLPGAGGAGSLLARGTVTAADGWLEQRIELDAGSAAGAADGDARVWLSVNQLSPGSVVFWSGWRRIDTSRRPRRALLVLVDTLRADALGCYGHPSNRTPTLDGLAADGARCELAIAQAHWTRPSMPSLMTGHYVAATSVTRASEHLHGAYTTLAESFAAAGFHTLGVLANSHAGRSNGLDQGLDELILDEQAKLTERFLANHADPRLDDLAEEDLFTWLHLMEVHGPYGPPERPADHREPGPDAELLPWTERFDRSWHERPTAAARVAYYNRDLESLDASLGAFLDRWLGRWEADGRRDTAIAVASDHGELLGEYGRWGHRWERHVPETVRVPLLFRAPERLPAGRVLRAPVENIDMAATLLELAGVDLSGARGVHRVGGRSLVPWLSGEAPVPDGLQALSGVDPGHVEWGSFALVTGHGALTGVDGGWVSAITPDGTPTLPPPGFGGRGSLDVRGAFRALWAEHLAAQATVRAAVLDGAEGQDGVTTLDAEALEQMRALGYLGR